MIFNDPATYQPRASYETVIQVLSKALDTLSDQRKWCTGFHAAGRTGLEVQPSSPLAEYWDFWGALKRAAHDLNADHAFNGAYCAVLHVSDYGLNQISDDKGRIAAMTACRLAIRFVQKIQQQRGKSVDPGTQFSLAL